MGTLFDIRRITTTNCMMKFIFFLAFFVGLAAARSFSYENDYINRGSIRQTTLKINRRPRMIAPRRTPCTIPPTMYRRPVRRTIRRRPVRTYRRTSPCNYLVRTMSPCQTNNLISNLKQMTPCQYQFVSSCTNMKTIQPCQMKTIQPYQMKTISDCELQRFLPCVPPKSTEEPRTTTTPCPTTTTTAPCTTTVPCTTTTLPCLETTTVSTPEVSVDPVPEPKPELVIRTLANIVEVAQPDN